MIDQIKVYPRTGDTQTVYLKSVVKCPTIEIGDYTIYNDFVNDPRDFEKNNVRHRGRLLLLSVALGLVAFR